MEREKVDKIINISLKVLFSLLFVLIFLSIMRIEATKKPPEEIKKILEQQQQERIKLAAGEPLNDKLPNPWPPKMNKPYPDLPLVASDGTNFKLANYKGKVIVLSFLDMSSPTAQAQSGAGLSGTYGVTVDTDPLARPFSDIFRTIPESEDMNYPHKDLLEIIVLVYSQDGKQATVDDAQRWADHFDLSADDNVIVAVPAKDIRSDETGEVLNGYQLIDKNMILRVDSSGPSPKHNLKMTLMPLVPKLLR